MSQRPQRRAPRLAPDQLLAPHITRVGRFRKINPTKPAKKIGCARVIGFLAWAGFVAEVGRRAWRASRTGVNDRPHTGGD